MEASLAHWCRSIYEPGNMSYSRSCSYGYMAPAGQHALGHTPPHIRSRSVSSRKKSRSWEWELILRPRVLEHSHESCVTGVLVISFREKGGADSTTVGMGLTQPRSRERPLAFFIFIFVFLCEFEI